MSTVLEVSRRDLRETRTRAVPDEPLADGEARLAVHRFGLSANNVTYALAGDALGYWAFFPAEDEGWGRVPTWGFAEVVESRADALPVGRRAFGFLPPATSLVVRPDRVTATGFVDTTPHRAALPAAYNAYVLEPDVRDGEDVHLLLHPLFLTAYVLAELCVEDGAAPAVVLSSASSKTAIAVAHLLSRDGAVAVIGLTSPARRDFVTRLGVHDHVLTYDELGDLPDLPTTFVDLAGRADLHRALGERLGSRLARTVRVGLTHQEAPDPSAEFFFAPDHIARRSRELGRTAFERATGEAWHAHAAWAAARLRVVEVEGLEAAAGAWRRALDGDLAADEGLVVRPDA